MNIDETKIQEQINSLQTKLKEIQDKKQKDLEIKQVINYHDEELKEFKSFLDYLSSKWDNHMLHIIDILTDKSNYYLVKRHNCYNDPPTYDNYNYCDGECHACDARELERYIDTDDKDILNIYEKWKNNNYILDSNEDNSNDESD